MTVLNKPAVAGSLFFNRRLRCVADLRIVDDIVVLYALLGDELVNVKEPR